MCFLYASICIFKDVLVLRIAPRALYMLSTHSLLMFSCKCLVYIRDRTMTLILTARFPQV